MTQTSIPTVRLSAGYFFYFAIYGGLLPFLARFLRDQGFAFTEISQTAAVLTLSMSLGPFVWASVSDRTGKRMVWARLSSLALLISLLLLGLLSVPVVVVAMVGLIGIALSAILPQMEAVTLQYLGPASTRYGNIRLWGTLGFGVVVLALGALLDYFGASVLPWCLALIAVATLVTQMLIKDVPRVAGHVSEQAPWSAFLQRMGQFPVWGLFLALFLWSVTMAAYNTFFDLYLQEYGYSGAAIGRYLALAPLAEVLLFLVLSRLLQRWGAKSVLVMALLATSGRWLMTAWLADSWVWLALAQCLHALSFGAVHGTAIYLLSRMFPDNQQARAQATYIAFSTGLGLVSGNLLAGQLWAFPQGSQWVFTLNAVIALVAGLLVAVALQRKRMLALKTSA
ncbi:MAG: MFS transporter [Natronospirillum sp.]